LAISERDFHWKKTGAAGHSGFSKTLLTNGEKKDSEVRLLKSVRVEIMEESELLRKRIEKISALKAEGGDLYPNGVGVGDTPASILERFKDADNEALAGAQRKVYSAGRMMAIRNFGKAAFINIQDRKGRIQHYLHRNSIGDASYALFKRLDVGDIVFIGGRPIRTKTGELTIEADEFMLLSKAIQPLPEKWHGLTDVETRYRQRHVDLIVNPKAREVFISRSRIINAIRQFMDERDFWNGDAMMQPKAGRRPRARPRDASQRPGDGSLSPHRPRTVSETSHYRRDGTGLRNKPELP
jgi:lysyl-tRNA synthetase class 2